VRATVIGDARAPTGLRHFGIDVRGTAACADPKRALSVLDGVAMPSPERTIDLVAAGRIVRVDRRSVAAELADRVLDQRTPALDRVPVSARLASAARAVSAPGRGVGFVLDDGRLWPVRPPEVAGVNDSKAEEIDPERWDAYPAGLSLGR
jgi:hypothetical protein